MNDDRRAPEPPRRPRKSARASWRTRLPRLPWYLDKLRQIEEGIEKLLDSSKFNAAGFAALMRRAVEARAAIDGILAETPDELEGATPEQLLAWAGLALEGWPDQVLEVAFRVYSVRHRGRVVFVSEAGHRAEYDVEEGAWTRE